METLKVAATHGSPADVESRGAPLAALPDGLALALLDSAAAAVYYVDLRGALRYVNLSYRRLFGDCPDAAARDFAHGVHPQDRERVEAAWADFCLQPRATQFRYRGTASGEVTPSYAESLVAVRGGAGFVGVITDVTELATVRQSLEHAERRLRQEHDLLKGVIETLPAWVYWKDRELRYIGCNREFASAMTMMRHPSLDAEPPLTPAAIIGRTVNELGLPAEIATESTESEAQVIATNTPQLDVPIRFQAPGSGRLHLLDSRIPLRNRDGDAIGIVGVVTDVTPIIEAHEALTQLQRRWDLAFQGSGDGVWDWNRDAGTLYLSSRWKQMLGYDEGDLDSTLDTWVELQHPNDRDTARRELRAHLRGETSEYNVEQRLRHKDGGYRSILVRGRIADRDARGRAIRIVGTTSDVTDFKRQEVDAANARKLEAIGQLAAGIAHELNTPAQFVGDNLRFLGETVSEVLGAMRTVRESLAVGTGVPGTRPAALDDADFEYFTTECPRAIEQSIEGIDRISKIVRALKELAHPGLDREPTDLNRAIQSTATVASNEWKYVADLRLELAPDLPLVPVTPSEFQQVVLNLIVNAAHALEHGAGGRAGERGAIAVRTSHDERWATVEIADDGCGIPEDIRAKVFDPFFTTKPLGKGTGQGLTIVHNVVKKHGGTIALESEVGRGTTFTIRLPLEDPASPAAA